jgi:hypothetical protein
MKRVAVESVYLVIKRILNNGKKTAVHFQGELPNITSVEILRA